MLCKFVSGEELSQVKLSLGLLQDGFEVADKAPTGKKAARVESRIILLEMMLQIVALYETLTPEQQRDNKTALREQYLDYLAKSGI